MKLGKVLRGAAVFLAGGVSVAGGAFAVFAAEAKVEAKRRAEDEAERLSGDPTQQLVLALCERIALLPPEENRDVVNRASFRLEGGGSAEVARHTRGYSGERKDQYVLLHVAAGSTGRGGKPDSQKVDVTRAQQELLMEALDAAGVRDKEYRAQVNRQRSLRALERLA